MELLTLGLCTIIAMVAVISLLLAQMIKREQQVIDERKDLLDRIMSKDFEEYKELTQESVTYEPVSKTDEQEFWDEIEARS